ncbi:hypothetical protein PISL3812_07391 [Talaromyces islandicus]|uniref:Uncharacterized protein n=1 Tax=Talaromyces islandicus TaxID=28573 RepID=A0A0U1M431_TALIS|nr:hypothetical protein PISL3812_07391 [Talaromyces islandicus]
MLGQARGLQQHDLTKDHSEVFSRQQTPPDGCKSQCWHYNDVVDAGGDASRRMPVGWNIKQNRDGTWIFSFIVFFVSQQARGVLQVGGRDAYCAATLMKENVSKEPKAEREEHKVHPARDTTQTAYWAKFPEFSLLTGF